MKYLSFFNLFIFIIYITNTFGSTGISDLRKCADEECKEIISEGRTTQRYFSRDKGVLGFNIDEPVQIFSKEAGSNKNLWGVKINNREGYIPRKFVKEEKEYIKFDKLEHNVPTHLKNKESLPTQDAENLIITSDDVDYNNFKKSQFVSAEASTNANIIQKTNSDSIPILDNGQKSTSSGTQNIKEPTQDNIDASNIIKDSINTGQNDVTKETESRSENLIQDPSISNQHVVDKKAELKSKTIIQDPSISNQHVVDKKAELKSETIIQDPLISNQHVVNKEAELKSETIIQDPSIPNQHVVDKKAELKSETIIQDPLISNQHVVNKEAELKSENVIQDPSILNQPMVDKNTEIKPENVIQDPTNPQQHVVSQEENIKAFDEVQDSVVQINVNEQNDVQAANVVRDPKVVNENVVSKDDYLNSKNVQKKDDTQDSSDLNTQDKKDDPIPLKIPVLQGSEVIDQQSPTHNEELSMIKTQPVETPTSVNSDAVFTPLSSTIPVVSNSATVTTSHAPSIPIKQIDNEDEGNGNEGEENGSEVKIKNQASQIPDSEEKKDAPNDAQKLKTNQLSNSQEPHVVASGNTLGLEIKDAPASSVKAPEPQPTPVSEVFDGTTIFLYDQEPNDNSNDSNDINDQSTLQASQVSESNHLHTTTTPLNSKNSSEDADASDASSKTLEADVTVNPKPVQVMGQNEQSTSTKDSSHVEFDSPKLETIIEIDQQLPDDEETSSEELPSSFGENTKVFNDFSTNENEKTESDDQYLKDQGEMSDNENPSVNLDNQILKTEEENMELKYSNGGASAEEKESPGLIASFISNFLPSTSSENNNDPEPTLEEKDTLDNLKPSLDLDNEEINNVENLAAVSSQIENEQNDITLDDISESKSSLDIESETVSEENNLIANLTFTDPTKMNQEPDAEPSSTDHLTSENTGDDQINIEDSPENTEDMSLTSSFTEQILNISRPVWHGIVVHLTQLSEGMAFAVEGELANPHMSAGSVVFLMIVSGTIVTLYFMHLLIMKFSRESPLLDAMNKIERQQRLVFHENETLKQKLSSSNGQIRGNGVEFKEIQKLKEEHRSVKNTLEGEISQLEERIIQLEADLESSVANAEELHIMNSDLLSNQKETSNFEESVNSLQTMLNDQREKVETLTSELAHKTRLNDELRNETKSIKAKSTKLEHQIEQLMKSLEEVNVGKQECLKRLELEENNVVSLREINNSLRKEAEETRSECENERLNVTRLRSANKQLQEKLHSKEAESQVSKECLKKLQLHFNEDGNNVNAKLSDLFNTVEIKSQFVASEKDRELLKEQLLFLEKNYDDLQEINRQIKSELSLLKDTLYQVQEDRDQMKSKLGVLSQYYEEKEAKLKKELESQEGLRINAEGSAATITNRIQSYEYEISSQRETIENLKAEFEEQKKSFKMQLMNEEKKAHEFWIASRSAERRQEELRQDNTQLRQRLSALHNQDRNANRRGETNGSLPSPPPHDADSDGTAEPLMMRPPMHPLFSPPNIPLLPPGMPPPGIPPPGLPPPGLPPPWALPPMIPSMGPHPDRRMPPAGRIASPPGYDHRSYSPASDHSHYSDHRRYSPGLPRYSPDRSSRRNARRRDQPSPSSLDRHSPDRWFTRSPQESYSKRHRSPPRGYYDETDNDESRRLDHLGKKTSTPLGPDHR